LYSNVADTTNWRSVQASTGLELGDPVDGAERRRLDLAGRVLDGATTDSRAVTHDGAVHAEHEAVHGRVGVEAHVHDCRGTEGLYQPRQQRQIYLTISTRSHPSLVYLGGVLDTVHGLGHRLVDQRRV